MSDCLWPPLGISTCSCEHQLHWETLLRFLLVHHLHLGQRAAPLQPGNHREAGGNCTAESSLIALCASSMSHHNLGDMQQAQELVLTSAKKAGLL